MAKPDGGAGPIYTIGHCTRSLEQLVSLLRDNSVRLLVDIRTVPKSRTNPQFNKGALQEQLPRDHGLQYEWLGKELGGLRKAVKDSNVNAGWDNASFRGYADYMQTPAFEAGLDRLLQLAAARGPAAIMCAEASHFSCHRRLVADALAARGARALHISSAARPPAEHAVTEFAKVEGPGRVTYPDYPHARGATARGRGRGRGARGGGGGGGGGGGRGGAGRKAAAAAGAGPAGGAAARGPMDEFVTHGGAAEAEAASPDAAGAAAVAGGEGRARRPAGAGRPRSSASPTAAAAPERPAGGAGGVVTRSAAAAAAAAAAEPAGAGSAAVGGASRKRAAVEGAAPAGAGGSQGRTPAKRRRGKG